MKRAVGSYMLVEERANFWTVCAAHGGALLGTIVFYRPWRRWIFQPEEGAEFSADCLALLSSFLAERDAQGKSTDAAVG